MATAVEVPQFGNTVEECLITRWIARKGAVVAAGEVIAEIETDKTTFEVTAPVDGTMLETFFEEGALVAVFTNLCVIGEVGEDVETWRPGSAVASSDPAAQSPNAISQSLNHPLQSSTHPITPSPGDVAAPMSPRAARFALAHDFHPTAIAGSGPGGRVLERDLRKAHQRAAAARTVERLNAGPRHTIARRMRESLASTAQYTLHTSADARGLLAARARMKASAGFADVTIGDLVAFATIQALGEVPALNAEFVDGEIVPHREVHLGFACDTPRGLMVPVVRDAHRRAIADLARRMKALATQAVDGAISPDDLRGATFTISNLGALGIESFTPLINPPQVAILGVGAIQPRPVRVRGHVDFIDAIGLSLTCDHQVIDGAPGARFLQTLREKIEGVESLLE